MSDGRIPSQQVEDFAAAVAAQPKLLPLTTTVGGVPELVWDANDELVLVEVVL